MIQQFGGISHGNAELGIQEAGRRGLADISQYGGYN